jgi:hypothetical protein
VQTLILEGGQLPHVLIDQIDRKTPGIRFFRACDGWVSGASRLASSTKIVDTGTGEWSHGDPGAPHFFEFPFDATNRHATIRHGLVERLAL